MAQSVAAGPVHPADVEHAAWQLPHSFSAPYASPYVKDGHSHTRLLMDVQSDTAVAPVEHVAQLEHVKPSP